MNMLCFSAFFGKHIKGMSTRESEDINRLSMRTRPPGQPIMHQTWGKLLFLHWPVPARALRPLIPGRLEIDTCEGTAWISVTPFTMWDIRLAMMPALPYLSTSHEVNVRTYVHLGGVPGVWFLSLDAGNALAVLGARLGFHLPYFQARMALEEEGRRIHFRSDRIHWGTSKAAFEAIWSRGESCPEAEPGTLDFFLIERYCLYAARGDRLYRGRIHHRPWPLCEVDLENLSSSMIASHGLPTPTEEPLLHGQRAPLHVSIWPPRRV